jgi:ethanolamine utilization protein EutN
MKIGLVIGNVVSTIKNDVFRETKLLLVQPLDLTRRPAGRVVVAVDTVGAGAGEEVILVDEGKAAADILQNPKAPVRALVVGIIDEIKLARSQ